MIGMIGILGCGLIAAAVCVGVAAASAIAAGGASAGLQSKAIKEQRAANKRAEARQRKSQAAQRVSDKRQANALRQQAAYGIILSRIDTRQTKYETDALMKQVAAGDTSLGGPRPRVHRGNYHNGTTVA